MDSQILILVGMFALMYFLLIRPQQKRAKDHKKVLSELKKGD
jgi:preprotein translocase subunit YajC